MTRAASALPAILACAASLFSLDCSPHPKTSLIVLGVDGMDPNFIEHHWNQLPNLARLRDEGYFVRLGTTTPPQSPVAWSTFITGLAPAQHGLFDFVHRNPHTLQPFSSMSGTQSHGWMLPVGSYRFPLSSSRVVSLRHGEAFWERLAARDIPVTVIRMPTNYPPVPVGKAVSGMGTPDLRGTLGVFTFFTDQPDEITRSVSGGQIVKVHLNDGHVSLNLDGPPNPLRKDGATTSLSLLADVDRAAGAMRLSTGGTVLILREGEWSGWIEGSFPLIPHVTSLHGAFRVYAKQLRSRFELYVSPVNIDPLSPALPISTPAGWSHDVAAEIGRYSTLGIPEDTSALRQSVLTLDEFRSQALFVSQEEERLLRYSLAQFKGGMLFFYFSSVDQNSHILWGRYEKELLDIYREVDASIGEARRTLPSVPIVVLSDHGFAPFDRAVHLNTWLKDRGFLSLLGQSGEDTDLSNIDWNATEAYAIGLNGLYLNLRGREAQGKVTGQQRHPLLATLTEQLLAWRDPASGRQIVKSVYLEEPSPENASVAPDLVVGYARGYRASWQTALGGTPSVEVEDNTDAWIGDHCIDASEVPGVWFASDRRIQTPKDLRAASKVVTELLR